MLSQLSVTPEPFVGVDISFLSQRMYLSVDLRHLQVDAGDLALSLDPQCCQTEYCAHPVEIGSEIFAIIGGLKLKPHTHYQRMHGYRLMPIIDFPGKIKSYENILHEFPHQEARSYTGLVVRLPDDELYVFAEETYIKPVDRLI